jgi:NAD(P) transhydrogenase
MNQVYDYDLLVVGSGPAGQHAAMQAARIGKRAAIVERRAIVGGACVNTGTIPSKTLREAILFLTGYQKQEIYGEHIPGHAATTAANLKHYLEFVVRREIEAVRRHLECNSIEVLNGSAEFVDSHRIRVRRADQERYTDVTAAHFLIASGTEPRIEAGLPFDGAHLLTSDDIMNLDSLPRSLAVVGGGVIGCEYATMFAALGVEVTLIDKRSRLLPFLDGEIGTRLETHMRAHRLNLRLNTEVRTIELACAPCSTDGKIAAVVLADGTTIAVEKALYAMGRSPCSAALNLQAAGVELSAQGLIKVDSSFRSTAPHIFAAGDIIGFPSLASTAVEQGRVAVCRCFGVPAESVPERFPFGIYTIPEISYVGQTEEQLQRAQVRYAAGRALYSQSSRGLIIGDTHGMLKILFDPDTRRLLGVHIIGKNAGDLVHLGQAIMTTGATIDYFVESVFNYPTLAECCKIAALEGLTGCA